MDCLSNTGNKNIRAARYDAKSVKELDEAIQRVSREFNQNSSDFHCRMKQVEILNSATLNVLKSREENFEITTQEFNDMMRRFNIGQSSSFTIILNSEIEEKINYALDLINKILQ